MEVPNLLMQELLHDMLLFIIHAP